MKMNYFETNEREDMKLLYDFNLHTNLFTNLSPLEKYNHADASAYTVTRLGEERKFNIELKRRNVVLLDNGQISGHSFIDNTIMIESHKYADLQLDSLSGYEPLYINFLENGVVIIYNLNKLSIRPQSMKKLIPSSGYRSFEIASRQGLYLKDACIYKNYHLIKRIGEEWKMQESS